MALAPQKSNPVPLIIFIVLFVFSTVGLVLVSMEFVKARKQMDDGFNRNSPQNVKYDRMPRLKYALMKADEKLREVEMLVDKYRDVTGLANPNKEELKPLLDELKTIGESETATSLIGYIEILKRREAQTISGLNDRLTAANSQVEKLNALVESTAAKVTEKETAVAKRTAEIERMRKRHSADIVKKEQEATALRASLAAARSAAQKRERELLETTKRLEHQIVDLRTRLNKQQALKVVDGTTFTPGAEAADGKVLLVDKDAGVMLNIGQKKGVRRGLKFDVYTPKADGTRIKRAQIQIKTVFPDISRAILVDGGNPVGVVSKGDIIINPAFDPGKAKIFVADTVFEDVKKQAIREALAKYGSVLEDMVSIRTDYLIVGPQKGTLHAEAERLGVPLIREDELNAFLGR
jgi:NAD-dependent DNA ligase